MKDSNEKSAQNISESVIVSDLVEFLHRGNYKVRLEVPNLGQSADVVATRGRWVTLMEVKVRDWRKAIEQCRAHLHVADYVCIVIATKGVSLRAKEEITKHGFGLIHYDASGQLEWVKRPSRNSTIWLPQRRVLSSKMKRISYVH